MDSTDRLSHSLPAEASSSISQVGTPKPDIELKGQSALTTEHAQEQFKASFKTPLNTYSVMKAMVKNMPAPLRMAVGLAQSLGEIGGAVKKAVADLRSGASTFAKVSKSVIKGESPSPEGKVKKMDRAGAKAGLVAGKAILHTGRFIKGAAETVKEKMGSVNLSETFKPLKEGLKSLANRDGEVKTDKFKYVSAFREDFEIEKKVDEFVSRTMQGASQKEINSVKKHLYKKIDSEIKAEMRKQVKEINEARGETYSDSKLKKVLKNDQSIAYLSRNMKAKIQGKISEQAMASSLASEGKKEAIREHYRSEAEKDIRDSLESARPRLQACFAKVEEELKSTTYSPGSLSAVARELKKEEEAVRASLHPETPLEDKKRIMDEFSKMRGDLSQRAVVVMTEFTSKIIENIKNLEANEDSMTDQEKQAEVKALSASCSSAVRIPSTLHSAGITLNYSDSSQLADNMARIRQFTIDHDVAWL